MGREGRGKSLSMFSSFILIILQVSVTTNFIFIADIHRRNTSLPSIKKRFHKNGSAKKVHPRRLTVNYQPILIGVRFGVIVCVNWVGHWFTREGFKVNCNWVKLATSLQELLLLDISTSKRSVLEQTVDVLGVL